MQAAGTVHRHSCSGIDAAQDCEHGEACRGDGTVLPHRGSPSHQHKYGRLRTHGWPYLEGERGFLFSFETQWGGSFPNPYVR